MIGIWDYTVILTYMSAISAVLGIVVSLQGEGHPYAGIVFLMVCGVLDAFDGRVARTKKNRTATEINYGIQIDSLADLLAFGALPACIGGVIIRGVEKIPSVVFVAVIVLYILAALIRLAYFNVLEEERQKTETGNRKYYIGLPVTSSSLIFPTVLLFQRITGTSLAILYFVIMAVTAFAFDSKIHVPKPKLPGILLMCAVGLAELILLIVL